MHARHAPSASAAQGPRYWPAGQGSAEQRAQPPPPRRKPGRQAQGQAAGSPSRPGPAKAALAGRGAAQGSQALSSSGRQGVRYRPAGQAEVLQLRREGSLSLSLSLSLSHTHTHSLSLSIYLYLFFSLSPAGQAKVLQLRGRALASVVVGGCAGGCACDIEGAWGIGSVVLSGL